MDIKAYIESGNLEAYVLGALSDEEAAQVREDIARYPELANEVASIEEAIFEFAKTNSVTPPDHLQDTIWNSINNSANNKHLKEPLPVNDGIKTIPLHTKQVRLAQNTWKYAAVWVALGGSVVLNFMIWSQKNAQTNEVATINSRLDSLQASNKKLAAVVDDYTRGKNMMADTSMQTIVMHTVLKGHPMAATLYWSKDNAVAYVMMDALPTPPKGMQYQLWVIQDGKPVSMGVLPNNMASTPGIQKVDTPVSAAQAFAISLEKEGGSATPTAQNIYVLGKS